VYQPDADIVEIVSMVADSPAPTSFITSTSSPTALLAICDALVNNLKDKVGIHGLDIQ